MKTQTIQEFKVIGIAIRTTNENGQAAQDIPALWNKFMSESIADKIPNKTGNEVYCIYTDYEHDHTKPYTTVLGCPVATLENIPKGMMGKAFAMGEYVTYVAKGNIMEGMVIGTWHEIWNSDLPRKFTADFEVYGERAQNPENAEVDIFVAV
ncbi:GyrI-like domain-containing protein [Persicitalea sp.]|uniref:GyrI-like domain-containing protein n=1 Tax=Persicitalea sp. TaxID=3100273 RepID=UPI00359453D2